VKALYITHLYPPRHIGGTENYTHALARGLIARGHEAQVLCVEDWERGDAYWNGHTDDLLDGVCVRRLHLNWTKAPDANRYLYDNPLVADYVRQYVRDVEADVVHVTSCHTLSASVIGAAKQAGLPVVVTLTDFWFVCPRVTLVKGDGALCDGRVPEHECVRCLSHKSKGYRWPRYVLPENVTVQLLSTVSRHGRLTRLRGLRGMIMNVRDRRMKLQRALQQADRVLIASRSGRTLLQGNGVSMPIDVVPYGHDLSWLRTYTGKPPREALSFGFAGQISPMKGPHVLIEAYKTAVPEFHARLLIYGDMDKDLQYGRQLRSLANGRRDIEFRGTYPHAESGRIFSEIDVLVAPSLWNDYPLIINEAFAAQTPVIATDLGGVRDLVEPEVNGLLFERGNTEALARALRRAIAEPELLANLRRGIPPVKTIGDAVEEMLGIYRETMHIEQSAHKAL
jgi:glycosyltransferase involved in cell wall biosynthesis